MNRTVERVVLVTGGTDGIGRAVALQLARGGDRVLFVGRSTERGKQVLAELRKALPGVDHVFLPADLSLLSETARLADEVARHTDRLDAAVLCRHLVDRAGVDGRGAGAQPRAQLPLPLPIGATALASHVGSSLGAARAGRQRRQVR